MQYTEQFKSMISENIRRKLEPFFIRGYEKGYHFYIKDVMQCDMGCVPAAVYTEDPSKLPREFLLELMSVSTGAPNEDVCIFMDISCAINKEAFVAVMER